LNLHVRLALFEDIPELIADEGVESLEGPISDGTVEGSGTWDCNKIPQSRSFI